MKIQPKARRVTAGGLQCIAVDPNDQPYQPDRLVVLCHGFGAPGTDLVDCCGAMWQLEPERLARTRFVFPAAPIVLAGQGYQDSRAWWMIDIEQLTASIERGDFRDLRNESPPELEQCRNELTACVTELTAEAGLEVANLYLGGFSQGAMLATDVALHLPLACAGLIVWSGTLLSESSWRAAAARHAKFPVFQSHGHYDPILPFDAAVWLRDMLSEAGFPVEFVEFSGMHEIPMSAMRGATELICVR